MQVLLTFLVIAFVPMKCIMLVSSKDESQKSPRSCGFSLPICYFLRDAKFICIEQELSRSFCEGGESLGSLVAAIIRAELHPVTRIFIHFW